MDRRLVGYGLIAGLVFGAAAYLGRNDDSTQPAQESSDSNSQPYIDKREYHFHGDEKPQDLPDESNDPNPSTTSQDPDPEEDPQGDENPEDPPAEPETLDDNPGEED